MRLLSLLPLFFLHIISLTSSSPTPNSQPNESLSLRDSALTEALQPTDLVLFSSSGFEKRKGGGRGKGGSRGSGSEGTGDPSSSGGRPLTTYSFSSSSTTGGRTRDGSGLRPAYPGSCYAGGAVVPYTAGGRSLTRSISPYAQRIGALAFFPGLWLYGSVWAYPYGYPFYYTNSDGQNTTVDVTCLCQRYSVCGCDPPDDSGNSTAFLDAVICNGTDHPVNGSTVQVVTAASGSLEAYINGTLPNGTTAAGGTDPSNVDEISGTMKLAAGYAGYWVMAATVGAMIITGV